MRKINDLTAAVTAYLLKLETVCENDLSEIKHYIAKLEAITATQANNNIINRLLGQCYEKAGDFCFSLAEDCSHRLITRLHYISDAQSYYQLAREAFYRQNEYYDLASLYLATLNTLVQKTRLSQNDKYALQILHFVENSNRAFYLDDEDKEIHPKAQQHNVLNYFRELGDPANLIELLDDLVFATEQLNMRDESLGFAREIIAIYDALSEEDKSASYLKATYLNMQTLVLSSMSNNQAPAIYYPFWSENMTTESTGVTPKDSHDAAMNVFHN